MIDKMAKAIHSIGVPQGKPEWVDLSSTERRGYRRKARAARVAQLLFESPDYESGTFKRLDDKDWRVHYWKYNTVDTPMIWYFDTEEECRSVCTDVGGAQPQSMIIYERNN